MSSYYHLLQLNDKNYDPPTFNYTTAADQRTGPLIAQWAAVCTLLLLYALTQVLNSKFGATSSTTTRSTSSSGAEGVSGIGAVSAASSADDPGEEIADDDPNMASLGLSSPREREAYDQRYLGSHGTWNTRVDRAGEALRTNLLLLLAASTLVSLPIEYDCATYFRRLEGDMAQLEMACGPCLANSTSSLTTILTWLFVAATIIWALLELLVADPRSSAVTRFVLILLAQPLMVVVFVLAFARWNYLKGLLCKGPANSGPLDPFSTGYL